MNEKPKCPLCSTRVKSVWHYSGCPKATKFSFIRFDPTSDFWGPGLGYDIYDFSSVSSNRCLQRIVNKFGEE